MTKDNIIHTYKHKNNNKNSYEDQLIKYVYNSGKIDVNFLDWIDFEDGDIN